MSRLEVLIVESDLQKQRSIQTVLNFIDYDQALTTACSDWKDAASKLESVEVILLGSCDADQSVLDVFRDIKEWNKAVPVILIAPKKEIKQLPEELTDGVLTIVDFPLRYQQLNNALHQASIFLDENKSVPRSPELFRSLVGNSRGVREVRRLIDQVADTDANVLILGESGTGKEVVARNLHYNSSRRDHPFVPINCGAIPADLLESELFGHEKGAFTGAITARQGRFELANGGTLFLDEIGDMSLPMQVKLLRVLQERVFERVGSNKGIKVDVRIIAATHRNLEDAIKENKFREDLYYRLNVFPIEMPPLRERIEDIPLLVNELITRLGYEKRGAVRLTPAAILVLCQHHWPGNVRELANLIERLVIMHPYGVVDVYDLPEKYQVEDVEKIKRDLISEEKLVAIVHQDMPRLPREGINLKEHLHALECNLIKQALDDADGVVAHAANRLQLRRTTLVEKLRKYGLQRNEHVS